MQRAPLTDLVRISRKLGRRVDALRFAAPVAYVYNPLVYARAPHEQYLRRWGEGTKEVLLLGMNPGPFGMAQTGVPFGEVRLVRDFVGVCAPVNKPPREHPKRIVEGFECPRSEVSGSRVWGWVEKRFGTAEHFFERFFVVNYCPLVFMEESGRNRTPDKLPKAERAALESPCDDALRDIVRATKPRWVVGVGAFATAKAHAVLGGADVRIGTILHPSPASPRANRGWEPAAEADLRKLGIRLPAKPRLARQ